MSMTTNKQTLRQKARLASAGEWVKESGDGWEATCSSDDQANAGFVIAHFEGPDAKANREFAQAANPATVLALLDELEAAERWIKELESQRALAFMACNRWADKFREAEKRIAELEAREVALPDYTKLYKGPFAMEVEHQVKQALAAAGITTKGE